MSRINLNLSPDEADALHTALVHTRLEYLMMRDRDFIHQLAKALRQYEKPTKHPARYRLRDKQLA